MRITLKAARINKGLTQTEAAKELQVNKKTLSNWENGKSFPNADKIEKIEKVYHVNYDDLIFLPSNYA